ncbi:uncharacterized protein LOC128872079 isoform X1 [Hylaeus volcanicus]|uniref:uncharacterized protein LOC128872079 isoform X1 n=1 Tax=Hylaeus volcanicus TaxID=313075 RepID=UPI0023B786C1|nr:uncharacterized protein LOC128872079 isoform X1 [Hylaeus volcanicus]
MLPSSKLLHEGPAGPVNENTASRDPSNRPTTTSVMDATNRNDDDPPPYTAIAPPNHVGWLFDFSGIPYSACTTTSCRAEAAPLAPFQATLTSASAFHPEGTDGQHTSISVPLMPRRLFKFGSHRSLFMNRAIPMSDDISVSKDTHGRTRSKLYFHRCRRGASLGVIRVRFGDSLSMLQDTVLYSWRRL